jgi:aminopeptidase-like protein
MSTTGTEMYELIRELYPINRSITGNGLRQSLAIIGRRISLDIREIPTGTQVLDWVVPKEWNIRDAFVKDPQGRKIIDFQRSNLHVVNYSIPVRMTVSLEELRQRLFSLPERPDWVPYRTSYYTETWGFCLQHSVLQDLPDGQYEVFIDSTLEPGSLTLGECVLRGDSSDEILISCHCCHPSLCNDNLSGMALCTQMAKTIANRPRRYTYRFVFAPGTIGAIAWLALNEEKIHKIKHGLVIACVGDEGPLSYKKSRRGNAEVDRAAQHVLRSRARACRILEFSPLGYDERQYCSPGFNLPVGTVTRSHEGAYPQYPTSADDLDLVRPEALADSLSACMEIVSVLEQNGRYISACQKGEPQLGRRGLYRSLNGRQSAEFSETALRWVLNYSDGEHSLLDIAEQSGLRFAAVKTAASLLESHGLLRRA